MSYLHHQNIVHPDLKRSNIFFDSCLLPKISNYSDSLKELTTSKHLKEDPFDSTTPKHLKEEFVNLYFDIFCLKNLIDSEKSNEFDIASQKVDDSQNKNYFIDLKRFDVIKYIGHGSFGKVFLVKERRTGREFAAKIIKSGISSNYEEDDQSLNFFREIKLMSALNHPAVIGFAVYSPTDFQGLPYPTTILEYASNGTLQDILKLKKKRTFTK